MIRGLTKELLQFTGSRRLNRVARKLRGKYYQGLESIGQVIFSLLRRINILSPNIDFTQKKTNRVLVIRADRLGDLILSTPSLANLRKGFPQAHIAVIINIYTKDLIIDSPMIDEIIAYDSKMSLYGKINFIRKLRKKKFDLAVVLYSTFWWCLVSFLSGAHYRIGYKERGGGFFLTKSIPPEQDVKIIHEAEKTLNIIKLLGISINNKDLHISITKQGEEFANDFLKINNIDERDKVVAIHPGSRQSYIQWQKEGYAEVADALIEKYGCKILLVGPFWEKRLVHEVIALMKNSEKAIPIGDTSITQLISLLRRCILFIGNSTGPMHIATALKVPVAAIFGCIHPEDSYHKWGPWGDNCIVVSKNLQCPDCHPSDCQTFECMKSIKAHDVMKAVDSLLLGVHQEMWA